MRRSAKIRVDDPQHACRGHNLLANGVLQRERKKRGAHVADRQHAGLREAGLPGPTRVSKSRRSFCLRAKSSITRTSGSGRGCWPPPLPPSVEVLGKEGVWGTTRFFQGMSRRVVSPNSSFR